MLALIENKWDVKFIQILPAPTEGVFEIPGKRKILENYFKNIIRFFLDQASSSSDPPKIPHTKSFPVSIILSVKFNPSQLKPLFKTVVIGFPTFSAPFDHMPLQVLDIQNHMPSKASQICYQAIYRS